MAHTDVYKWFELYFPLYAGKNVAAWFPNGKNSIRIRQTNSAEFIFTYNGEDNWKLETVRNFLDDRKGAK